MTNLDQLKSIYDYAISYTEKGFSVICLKPKSKHPSIPSWKPFTVSKASKEQLESWFKNTANNIGIVTGKTSSIFAIDIDGQEAYNYFFQKIDSLSPVDKQLIQSIKDTMKIKTGSGNTNLIFRFDPNEFPIGDELANTILWKDSSANQQPNHSEIRLKGEGSYIVAPPSIHPDNNNDYTLVNGINPTALSREQINKLIEILNIGNKSYNNSNFHFQNKSHNDQKLADLEIDEKTIYEIIARVMPYYHGGIRNDFVLYFSGWLRKLGVSYDNAEKIIKELVISDEERNNRIKTLRETYQKQNLEEVAGYSYLLELLSDQASGSQDTIAKLKEIPKILEAKHIIKKDIKGHKKQNNESRKEKKEIVTFKYSQMGKGELYEAVLSGGSLPFFTKYNYGKKEFELVENIEENSRILRPPEREEYPYTPYEFSGLEEINHDKGFILNNNVDRDYLFQKSKSIISKFNNQDDYKLTLIAVDVILSYSQDRFSTIHYDFIVGGNGSGKSSLGDTFGAIAYRAVIMTDPTAPNLFRLLGSIEPAQCTIVLEEADRIDKSPELMAILKTGYARNGRVPKINPNTLKQEFFFSFCQKIIISERSLSQSIAKGVNTRILPINTFKGETKYDIKEVLNPTDTGGKQNKELLNELEDFRKLLLVYRLMHFKDPIPDLDIGIDGRDKELVKHLIQLFYGSKCLEEIVKSLQKFLDLKNQKKETSLEHALFPIISDVIKFNGPQILLEHSGIH